MIKIPQDEIKKILVVNLGGVGDLLFSIPALRALRGLYPQGYISLLTIPRSLQITNNLSGLVDEVFVFKGALDFICHLRKNQFDMAINMRTITSIWSALKAALLFSLIGARYNVGRDTQERGFFLNIKLLEKDIATMHDVDYNLGLVGLLGADKTNRRIELGIRCEDRLYIEDFLRQNKIEKDDILIGINPTATWQTKCWPIENFAEVINGLIQSRDCRIVVTGTGEDIPLVNRLQGLLQAKFTIAAGKTDIGQLAAFINRCNLFITNDGGPMHIASILKRPLIAIFGPTDILRFGLYGHYKEAVVLYKRVDCSPCFKKKCRRLKCLKSIRPQEVIGAANRLLNEDIRDSRK